MLPWFKNSGVVIDDDILALSLVINKIIEAEKNGYTDPQETAKILKLSYLPRAVFNRVWAGCFLFNLRYRKYHR